MAKVYLDSDVIIDFLLDRAPFSEAAGTIFALGERSEFHLFTSTASFLNVNYIAESISGRREARPLVRKLRSLLSLLPVTEQTIDRAIAEGGTDLEDSVQYRCARDGGMEFLVTRNTNDYPKEAGFVMSPDTFLRSMPNEWDSTPTR